MKRAEGWDVRLVRWADSRRGAPFAWGVVDCAMLAFEAIDAIAGVDELAALYRARWDSERSALRFQVRENTDTARVLAAAGCEQVADGFHQRGDIIVVPQGGFQCAHVCMGVRSLSVRPGRTTGWELTTMVTARPSRTFRLGG